MSITSKSPRAILFTAFQVATNALPAYSHANSPKKYTQHQIFACLVLKSSMKLDYRGVCGLLSDSPDLRRTIGLFKTPHGTTLHKACSRLLTSPCAAALLEAILAPKRGARGRSRRQRRKVKTAAGDSSGFDTHHSSRYFVARKSKGSDIIQNTTYRQFPKLGIVCDCGDHMILASSVGNGPRPDVDEFRRLAPQAIQVADRWHLLKNLGDSLKRLANRFNGQIRLAAQESLRASPSEVIQQQSKGLTDPVPQTDAMPNPARSVQKGT